MATIVICLGTPMTSQPAWRLIHTKPHQELIAADNLKRQGYIVYLPLLNHRKQRGGKQVYVRKPLFPRYLFIYLTAGLDDWGPIRSTIGVSSLVRFGMEPARVPEDLITNIKSREGEDGCHHEHVQELKEGDKIRITDGAFSGYEAIFQAKRSEERVLILLDVIGVATRVEVLEGTITKDI